MRSVVAPKKNRKQIAAAGSSACTSCRCRRGTGHFYRSLRSREKSYRRDIIAWNSRKQVVPGSFTERMESSVHSSRKKVSPCSSNSLLGTGTAHTPRKGCRSWRTECRRVDRLGRLQTVNWLLREVAKRVNLLGGRSLAVDAWMSVAEHGICNEGSAKSSPHRVRGLGWCRECTHPRCGSEVRGRRDALEQIAAKRTRSSPDDWTRPWRKR